MWCVKRQVEILIYSVCLALGPRSLLKTQRSWDYTQDKHYLCTQAVLEKSIAFPGIVLELNQFPVAFNSLFLPCWSGPVTNSYHLHEKKESSNGESGVLSILQSVAGSSTEVNEEPGFSCLCALIYCYLKRIADQLDYPEADLMSRTLQRMFVPPVISARDSSFSGNAF